MNISVNMWRTTKRITSTATPVSQPGWFTNKIEKSVCLKEPTDILSPIFKLHMTGHDGQNYLQAFGRYYWITGIKALADDLFEISCKLDEVGSYRGHIRNTHAYVLYDSTANTEIPDQRLGIKSTPTTQQNTVEMPWNFASGTGSKFIALEGDGDLVSQNKAQGATGVYTVTDSDITAIGMKFTISEIVNSIASYYTVDVPGASILDSALGVKTVDDMVTELQNAISNVDIPGAVIYAFLAFQFIGIMAILGIIDTIKGLIVGGDALKHVKSAYWLPFDCSDQGTACSSIAIGSFVDNLPGAKKITTPFRSTVLTVNIPWQFSDWRNVQNTEIQLFIPLIGNINIPTSAVKGHSTITIRMNLNMFSGQLSCRVQCGDITLGSYGSNVAMPILIGDSNPNIPSIANTIVSTGALVAGMATGAGALTAGALAGGIQSGLNCIQPISTAVGGIGGGAGNQLGIVIVCSTICHDTSDNPANLLPIIGTPTNKLKQLNGSGFCQCLNAQLNMTAVTGESYPTETEVQAVNNALNSGVYLE